MLEEIASVCSFVGDNNLKHQDMKFKQLEANWKVLCRLGATVQTFSNEVEKTVCQKGRPYQGPRKNRKPASPYA